MKIVLSPVGARGEVEPMFAIGTTLQARGHYVMFCAPESYRSRLMQLGFRMFSCGANYEKYLEGVGLQEDRHGDLVRELAADVATQFVAMRDATRDADVIVGSALMMAGPSLAEQKKIPYISTINNPLMLDRDLFPSLGLPGGKGAIGSMRRKSLLKQWDKKALKAINLEREYSHLNPVSDLYAYMMQSGHVLAAVDPDFTSLKSTETLSVTGFWYFDEPAQLESEVEDYLKAQPPLVYVGSLNVKEKEAALVKKILQVLVDAGFRAVLGSQWTGMKQEELPTGCRLMASVPYAALFPRMAAVIHKGSAEVTAAATRFSVPQVVVPHLADQFYWAERVRLAGIGIAPVELQPEQIAKAVKDAVSDSRIREAGKAIGEKIRARDGVTVAADTIEKSVLVAG